MGLFSRPKPKVIDRREALAGVPHLSENVSLLGEEAEGPLTLRLQLRRSQGSKFLDRFRPPVFERDIKLDQIGSFVVRQIDGRRSVREIIDQFLGRYQLSRREAELSVVAFIKALMQRGALTVYTGDA